MTDANNEQQQPDIPSAVEAEIAVLAAVLVEPKTVSRVVGRLTVDDFYQPRNKRIFEQVLTLHAAGHPVDHVGVRQALKEQGRLEMIGGNYIAELALAYDGSTALDYHCDLIVQTSARRQAIKLAQAAMKDAREAADVSGFLSTLSQRATEIAQRAAGGKQVTMLSDLIDPTIEAIVERSKDPDAMPGIASGLPAFDDILGGWQPGTINIVAARPGMGKTQFGIAVAHHAAAVLGKRVDYYSLEMPKDAITRRWLSQVSQIDQRVLKFARFEYKGQREELWNYTDLGGAANRVAIIDSTDEINTVEKLAATAKKIEESVGEGQLAIIDHVGHLHDGDRESENRNREMARIFEKLRYIVNRDGKTLIVLSQLSRNCETRQDKRPTMADLRDSGEIEQHADTVTMIYRDEYYNPETTATGAAELIVRKQRDGEIGTATVGFHAATGRFYGLASSPGEQSPSGKSKYGKHRGAKWRGGFGDERD